VAVEVSSIGAISLSRSGSPPSECLPTSALSRMRARLSILAGALPAQMSLCNRSRSSAVSSTTYVFTVALSFEGAIFRIEPPTSDIKLLLTVD
jgi:hypothetical protein